MSAAAMLSASFRSGETPDEAAATSFKPEAAAEAESQPPTSEADVRVVNTPPAPPAPVMTGMTGARARPAESALAVSSAMLAEPPAAAMAAERPEAGAAAETVKLGEPAATAPASTEEMAAVTITGCLELDDDTFRLKNTTGADVPRARSWKRGFLKKASASIDIVDASSSLGLTDHVGRRVAVTGTLVDREMQARSLQRVAASCDRKA